MGTPAFRIKRHAPARVIPDEPASEMPPCLQCHLCARLGLRTSRRSRVPALRQRTEFVAVAIRDWCRAHGTGTANIEPGSPWQNPYVESFNGRLRDELFSREVFDTITEARLLFNDWCDTYNRHRPHSSLGYLPPAVFAAAFNQPKPS